LPLYLVEVKVNFTKYCRLPGSERLSFGCYFSYGNQIFFKSMLRAGKDQFIHRATHKVSHRRARRREEILLLSRNLENQSFRKKRQQPSWLLARVALRGFVGFLVNLRPENSIQSSRFGLHRGFGE